MAYHSSRNGGVSLGAAVDPKDLLERKLTRLAIPVIDFARSGGYRVLARLATQWTRAGIDVRFLVPDHSDEPYFATEASITRLNLCGTHAIPGRSQNRSGVLRVMVAQAALTFGLRRLGPFDLVLANHWLTVIPSLAGARGAPVVQYVQADEREYVGQGAFRLLQRAIVSGIYLLPVRRVLNGSSYANSIQRHSLGVVPPGIDLETFHPRGPILTQPEVRVGTIVREERWKGTENVVEALKMLQASRPEISVSLAFGDDSHGPWPGKQEHVRPDGDSSLSAWYRSLDIYVGAPVGQEGVYHYPFMEALASGLAVVCPPYAPASSKNAWILSSRDPMTVVETLERVLTQRDVARALARKGPTAVAELSWQVTAARMLTILSLAIRDV